MPSTSRAAPLRHSWTRLPGKCRRGRFDAGRGGAVGGLSESEQAFRASRFAETTVPVTVQ